MLDKYQSAYKIKGTFWKKSFYNCILQPSSFLTKYVKTLCLKILLIYHQCRGLTLAFKYIRKFLEKFEMSPIAYSRPSGKLIC